jgi:hypothetical protein
MVLLRFSSKEFVFFRLELAGFSGCTIRHNKKKMNRERFKDSFYASPQIVENIFDDIQDEDLGESRISKPNPLYLLLGLFYLKKYPTKHALAAFLDSTEKTVLTWAKGYVQAIQALKKKKVSNYFHL